MFAWDVSIPDDKIKVKVEHGGVTLTGTVDWYYQSNEAQKVAGKVSGVTGVSRSSHGMSARSPNAPHGLRLESSRSMTISSLALNVIARTNRGPPSLPGGPDSGSSRKMIRPLCVADDLLVHS